MDSISRQRAIDTEGLDEQIRCEMCRNPMHTDRGCDGNCKYDEKLYERIMQILGERIKPLPSVQPELCNDAISRQAAINALANYIHNIDKVCGMGKLLSPDDCMDVAKRVLDDLPSVQPEIMPDGTLHITANVDVASIDRILLTQEGTHSGDLYYRDDEKPKRKTGMWIHHKPFDCEHHNCNTCIECSCCGTWFGADSYAQTNYCPNCGVYMREEGGQE